MKTLSNLTPENAVEHGYEYVQDVVYDEQAPSEAMEDLVSLDEQGYVLGQSAASLGKGTLSGLYKPVDQPVATENG